MEPRSVPAGRDTCEQHSASSTTACVKHTAGRPHRPCDRPWRHGGSRPLPRCRPRFRRDCRVRSLICGARPFRPAGHRPSGPVQCLLGFRPGGDAGPRRFRRRVFRPSRSLPRSGSVRWRCCPPPALRNGLEHWRFPVPGCPGAGLLLRHCSRRCVRCLPARCLRPPHAGGWGRPRRPAYDRLDAGRQVAQACAGPPCLRDSCLPCCDGSVRRAPRTACTCNGQRSGSGNDKCRALRQCACLLGGKGRSMPIPAQAGREQGRERPGGPPSRDRLRCVPAPAVPRNACLPPWPRGGRRPSHRPARRCIGPGPVRRWRSVHRAGGSPGRP